jgi:hypothetical protein
VGSEKQKGQKAQKKPKSLFAFWQVSSSGKVANTFSTQRDKGSKAAKP